MKIMLNFYGRLKKGLFFQTVRREKGNRRKLKEEREEETE